MHTKLIIHHGLIQVYYSFDGKILRHSTKIKATSNFDGNRFNHKEPKFRDLNHIISGAIERVDSIIHNYIKDNDIKPPVSFIKGLLDKGNQVTKGTRGTSQKRIKRRYAVDFFKEYYQLKLDSLIRRPSLKDYKSFENSLRLYEYVNKKKLTLEDINDSDFFIFFETFLSTEHKLSKEEIAEYKTKGGLNHNTLQKRISHLKMFLNHCTEKGYIDRNRIKDKKLTVITYRPKPIVMTSDELKQLKALQLTGSEEKVRDAFLFGCSTGVRISDLTQIGRTSVQGNKLIKDAQKVSYEFEVPLSDYCLELLEKHNYNFKHYSDQAFNREIKALLKKYNICNYIIPITRYSGNKKDPQDVKKFTKISSHTMRRTFISRAIKNNIPINLIMKSVGITQLSTLTRYIEVFGSDDDDDSIRRMEF